MNDFTNIPMISQPIELKVNLYPHQLATVYKMESLEHTKHIDTLNSVVETNMGINCNKTGYGKTLEMITLVLRNNMTWDLNYPHIITIYKTYADQNIIKTEKRYYSRLNTTLILIGPSVVKQWENELMLTPLKWVTVQKPSKNRKQIDINKLDVSEYDIILVLPECYNKLVTKYRDFAWKRFIFDEPSDLRVPAMESIISGFTWFVTATPDSICLKHYNCRTSYMSKLFPRWHEVDEFLPYICIKNSPELVELSYNMPETLHKYYQCYSPLYNTLKSMVNPYIDEMLSAGNISGIIKYFGGKSTDNVVKLVQQKKSSDLEIIEQKIKFWSDQNNNEKVEKWSQKRNIVITQLNEIKKRFNELLNGYCTICHDKITKPILEPNCQNIFCGECLLNWFKQKHTCPLCRIDIDRKNLIYITDKKEEMTEIKNGKSKKTKESAILEIVKNPGKYIIFSNWNETFTTIINLLKQYNIPYVEGKGSIETRNKSFERYRSGDVNVIFLNSRFNGAGINLQETTDIILYHTMVDDIQTQIIGRANRIGRKTPLTVHHLLEDY